MRPSTEGGSIRSVLRNLHRRFTLLPLLAAVVVLGACGVSVGPKSAQTPEAKPSAPTVTVTRTATPAPTRDHSNGAGHHGDEGLDHAGTATVPPSTPRTAKPTYDLSSMSLPGFTSPSGNIGCLFDDSDGPYVRCDRSQYDWAPGGKPADCHLDWGHAVELIRGHRGEAVCAGDTVMGQKGATDGSRVLQYGETALYRGILCTSQETGVTCAADAHGFAISRAAIRVF
jgi:hypothetical protein